MGLLEMVPILLWYDQFFVYVMSEFGHLLGTSLVMDEKLNLNEAWLKLNGVKANTIPPKLEVQLPSSSHILWLEVYSTEEVPFHSVSEIVAPSEVASIGSCAGQPVVQPPMIFTG